MPYKVRPYTRRYKGCKDGCAGCMHQIELSDILGSIQNWCAYRLEEEVSRQVAEKMKESFPQEVKDD